jgi:hypothetical protein
VSKDENDAMAKAKEQLNPVIQRTPGKPPHKVMAISRRNSDGALIFFEHLVDPY